MKITRISLSVLFAAILSTTSVYAAPRSTKNATRKTCAENLAPQLPRTPQPESDLFLEDVHGEKALAWVETQNRRSLAELERHPQFTPLKEKLHTISNSPDKLTGITIAGGFVYNFWTDAKNVKGLWRRTTISKYFDHKPEWEVLLDIDELSKKENENWVYEGALQFGNKAMISLSRGGKDAVVIREFDMDAKSFVADGFSLPEGKHSVTWQDADTILLGLAVEGETTDSGYPMRVRQWKRGTPPSQAPVIFEGVKKNLGASVYVVHHPTTHEVSHILLMLQVDFYTTTYFLWTNGKIQELKVPKDASITIAQSYLYLYLREAWAPTSQKSFPSGSLVRIEFERYIAGDMSAELLFEPSKKSILQDYSVINGRIFIETTEDVNGKVAELVQNGDSWGPRYFKLPDYSTTSIALSSAKDDMLIIESSNFLSPLTRYLVDLKTNQVSILEQAPERFDASPYKITQNFATSPDGTKVPYYMVARKDIRLDGNNPTIINAYGGFQNSRTPFYSYTIALSWLERGGVFVLANIRGGDEYGPEWHQQGLQKKRQNIFNDFYSVAEDLISSGVTNPKKLGAYGGSNGGLLMGVALTQRPDLYAAIGIQVPLLDMLRYHKLLAGSSWVAEYGDPEDPEMRRFLESYSPYQNMRADRSYPRPFFTTSTADDRVHPAHARRMAHLMEEQEHPFLYFENTEGGHGGAANNEQVARGSALLFTYFTQALIDASAQPPSR